MQSQDLKRCPHCNTLAPAQAVFCVGCKRDYQQQPALQSPRYSVPQPDAPATAHPRPNTAAKTAGGFGGLLLVALYAINYFSAMGIPSTYEIHVTTNPPAAFTGTYGGTRSDGTSASTSVSEQGYAAYRIDSAVFVSAVFQKGSSSGTLQVEVRKGGKVIASQSTEAPYGVVSLGER